MLWGLVYLSMWLEEENRHVRIPGTPARRYWRNRQAAGSAAQHSCQTPLWFSPGRHWRSGRGSQVVAREIKKALFIYGAEGWFYWILVECAVEKHLTNLFFCHLSRMMTTADATVCSICRRRMSWSINWIKWVNSEFCFQAIFRKMPQSKNQANSFICYHSKAVHPVARWLPTVYFFHTFQISFNMFINQHCTRIPFFCYLSVICI